MLIDTVSAVYEAEHDSEVIFNYILLLEKSAYPECISLVSKILDLVENASDKKAKTENVTNNKSAKPFCGFTAERFFCILILISNQTFMQKMFYADI